MKLAILKAFDNYHKYYIRACQELEVDFDLIDILSADWLNNIKNSDADGFLCRPPSKFQERKSMFDEKLYLIDTVLKRPIYPTFDELFLYENKRLLSYWLDLHNYPHPDTKVFYLKNEYQKYIKSLKEFPIVVKSNIGSTAKGVVIVKSRKHALYLAHKKFGLINPKLAKGHTAITTGRIIHLESYGSREKHFIIVQKFEQIKWEWRIVKIDESYFAHKRLLKGQFASGSHLKGWEQPPFELFYLIKNISDAHGFYSISLDIFETEDGRFLINEMQPLFGQKTKHLMMVDNQPGRFILKNRKFEFEQGNFNQNQSYNLRVKHFLKILNKNLN